MSWRWPSLREEMAPSSVSASSSPQARAAAGMASGSGGWGVWAFGG